MLFFIRLLRPGVAVVLRIRTLIRPANLLSRAFNHESDFTALLHAKQASSEKKTISSFFLLM
jgi:hypothetical protein